MNAAAGNGLRRRVTSVESEAAALVIEPSVRRWETGTRTYIAEVMRDLFGELILRCTNAGTGKRHYQERTIACGEDDIRRALILLSRVRRAHAYTLVEVSRSTDGSRHAADRT